MDKQPLVLAILPALYSIPNNFRVFRVSYIRPSTLNQLFASFPAFSE